MSSRTVLFTGGAGFIGLHVVPLLLERGYRVRIFDNMFRGDRDRVAELAATGRVELIDQDVRYGGAVYRVMRGCDHVIHFAAVSINKSQADPYESIDINMVGNHNVFAAAAEHRIRRLVYASSASVYGEPRKLPMHEDDELNPLTPYCIAKRAGEDLLRFYQRQRGLSWIALRFFNVYGPGQKPTAYYTSVINHFVARLRNGQPPVIDGRGEQSMDFIHVRDIARGVVAALESERGNMPINLGTGVDTSVAQLAKILIDAVGVDVTPEFNPRDVLVSRRAADIRRAREVLGWQPTVSIEDGMADLVRRTPAGSRRTPAPDRLPRTPAPSSTS
ncbi:UDP-glucose 4-epimerase [Longimycelium tulufanense]|uniref:UDP-glucose 4-epimerase n=1 Tax=Longimycelium tulufanense TaxID=907463 RepID=A0A8J3C782_9PSEU|nr:NAD-dependent epimerase/dehydratase family protein [Longimycelium tulufanense]GGM47860.1 UDP-glucose 4-epimerase [Longimycelium tulufanense]